MVNARTLQPLPVSSGPRLREILPVLERALEGEGPALFPVAEDDAGSTGRMLGARYPLNEHEDDPADPTALVIATSGSTGAPKGVLLPASALRASAVATHQHLGGPGHWLLAMPAQHIAGIQVLIRSLIADTRPHAVNISAGFRPADFAEAAHRTLASAGPHYTSLVPTQLSRLLKDGEGLRALRAFDAVLLGGATTPPDLLRQARERDVQVVTTYGMSETSGGCVYDGVPLAGVTARVANDAPQAPSPIRLAGPTLARGYRILAPAQPAMARPPGGFFEDGWFHTGDLGQWRDGRLEVLGRADDVIVTGGVNIAPLPVERVLTEHRGVDEACVLGIDDPEWGQAVVAAVVPADPVSPPSVEELRSSVREQLGAAAAPKHIALLPELPLRGPGKPDRKALREQLDL